MGHSLSKILSGINILSGTYGFLVSFRKKWTRKNLILMREKSKMTYFFVIINVISVPDAHEQYIRRQPRKQCDSNFGF